MVVEKFSQTRNERENLSSPHLDVIQLHLNVGVTCIYCKRMTKWSTQWLYGVNRVDWTRMPIG